MRISSRITLLAAALLLFAASYGQAASLLKEGHGTKATSYLELLDQSKLQEAWQSMAPLFKAINIEQQWQQKISTIRQVYGATASREIRRSSYRTSYRNAPDGEYVIIQFESSFEHKSEGVETVVLQCPVEAECAVIDYIIN